MNFPSELKYTKSHEWVKFLDGSTIQVGLTDYAQHALGDIVFVNLPQEGDSFEKGGVICDVESVKAVSDVYSPAAGVVCAVNEELLDAPESLNKDPYGAWMFQLGEVGEQEELLDSGAYEALCKEEAAN